MFSERTRGIGEVYTQRHAARAGLFGEKPYANYGYWSGHGETIDGACDALTEQVARAAGIAPGDRVLEVGCGYGAGTVHYTRRFHPSRVVALDITELRIQSAQEYVASCGLSDVISLGLGDATDLKFPDGAFERVVGIECALHFDTREDFLREAARVLAPGGGIGLADIVIRRGADRGQFLKKVHFPVGSDGRLDVVENVYDADVYAQVLRKCGFDDARVDVITDHTFPHFVAHLEGVAAKSQDEFAPRRIRAAQIIREYLSLGLEYVLVSARKPRNA
jgi:microcystin synthetase protein McyJ